MQTCSGKMQQEFSNKTRAEKPKIVGPKPTIPSKPKFIPPVKIKSQQDSPRSSFSSSNAVQTNNYHVKLATQPDVLSSEVLQGFTNISQQKSTFKPYAESQCNKSSYDSRDKQQAVEDTQHQNPVPAKAPNSPSTVGTSLFPHLVYPNQITPTLTKPNKLDPVTHG